MKASYYTVAESASAEVTIEKSRFIAYVMPVSSKDDADMFIASIRDTNRDATHNVPAYVIGPDQKGPLDSIFQE